MTPKYNNTKITVQDLKFDSKLEANFYLYIIDSDDIEYSDRQVVVELLPKTALSRAIKYIADFEIVYNNETFLVDAKGMETPIFKQKMNLYKRLDKPLRLIVAKSKVDMERLLEKSKVCGDIVLSTAKKIKSKK